MIRRLAILLCLAYASVATAAETWYVHTSVDGTGDDGSEAAPYDTLAQAVAAKAGPMAGRGVVTFYVDGTVAESTAVSLAGFTGADSSNYVRVICQDPPEGTWDTGRYRIEIATSSGNALVVPSYTRLSGVQLRSSGSGGIALSIGNSINVVVDRSILRGATYGAYISSNSNTFRNCIFLGGSRAVSIATNKYTNAFINCTGINVGYGIYAPGGSNSATNCYFSGSTAAYYTTGTLTLTNCYSNDGSRSTTVAACATDSGVYFTNVTVGSEDVHISTDSALHDTGADASGLLDPDEDCDGETRPLGNAFDVGADEFTETGGKAYTPVPATAATNQARSVALSWTAGTNATSHHVYFGTDASPDSDVGSSEYQGEQAETTFDPTGLLEYDTTYYWRIDEEDAEENVVTGTVWSFTTIAPGTYYASVDGTGDGSAVGTPRASGSFDWMIPGDVVILLDGTYPAATISLDGVSEDVITIQANTALGPVFTASSGAVVTVSGDYITLDGLKVIPGSGTGVTTTGTVVVFENGVVEGQISGGLYISQGYGILVEDGSATISNCDVSQTHYGVQFQAPGTLESSKIHNTASSIVRFGGAADESVTVDHCWIFNQDDSLSFTPDPHGSAISIKGNCGTIKNCLVYNGATSRLVYAYPGYLSEEYSNWIFENNLFPGSVVLGVDGKTYDYTESATYNGYVELVNWGADCIIRNNTFGCYVKIFLTNPASHTPGDGVIISNNLFAAGLTLSGWYDSGDDDEDGTLNYYERTEEAALGFLTSAVANGMVEAKNRTTGLSTYYSGVAQSIGWDDAWETPTSVTDAVAGNWAVGTMFDWVTGSVPFVLESSSVAVDAGSGTEGYFSTTDYFGNSRASTPDIGAIEYGSGTPPAKAATPSPADEATGVAIDVTLSWGAVSGATRYDVYISTDATIDGEDYQSDTWAGLVAFDTNEAYIGDMVGGFEWLTIGTTYYWRVDAIDDSNGITIGDVWSFTPSPPGAPTNLSPNGGTPHSRSQTLSWTAASGYNTYDVYLGTDADLDAGDLVSDNQAGTSYLATGLVRGTTYYWRVVGYGGNDFSEDANCVGVWNFESGALTTDTLGLNGDLVATGDPAADTDAGDFQQGAASCYFDGDDHYELDDANQTAEFPCKAGDTNGDFSVAFWFRHDGVGEILTTINLVEKGVYATSDLSWGIALDDTTLQLYVGYNNGAGIETEELKTDIAQDTWYHVVVTWDQSEKTWHSYVYTDGDSTASNTAVTTNAMSVEASSFYLWRSNMACPYKGYLDEVAVFNDILTQSEANQIRLGTYNSSESPPAEASFRIRDYTVLVTP